MSQLKKKIGELQRKPCIDNFILLQRKSYKIVISDHLKNIPKIMQNTMFNNITPVL
jgi:hypothetical protein